MAGKELRWNPVTEQYELVGKKGRAKGSGSIGAAVKALLGGGHKDKRPEEILVNEDAPYEVLVMASLQNFLNGYDMDHLVTSELERRRIDAEKIAHDRQMWAGQIHSIMDEYTKKMAERHENIGTYIAQGVLAGFGTIGPARGSRDKHGRDLR